MVHEEKPKAIATGTLAHIGINADCYVLSNGLRVLSQRGIVRALTGGRESGAIGPYLARLPNGSALLSSGAIEFELPGGGTALGRSDEWFVSMLKTYKSAWRAGALKKSQEPLAATADAMLDALAGVGLASLIDEATGYQSVRAHGSLARLFERMLLSQAAKWARMWPADVVESLRRTYDIKKVPTGIPAPMMGVIGWIYSVVLGPELHGEVKRLNPRRPARDKHHQHFQQELRQLVSEDLIVIKALSDQSKDKHEFKRRILSHYTKQGFQLDLV